MPVESIKGRGATRNPTPSRFNLQKRLTEGEWLDRVEALDGVPKRRTTVTIEHPKSHPDPQQVAGHRLRSFGERLSGLRAWLHLLLRPANPRLSRSFARRRFRIQALRKAQRSATSPHGAVSVRIRVRADRNGDQHRPLSADRGEMAHHPLADRAAGRNPPPLLDHDQVRPCAPRPRPAEACRGARDRLRRLVGDVTRSKTARTLEPRAPAPHKGRGHQGAERRWRALPHRHCAGGPADHRP